MAQPEQRSQKKPEGDFTLSCPYPHTNTYPHTPHPHTHTHTHTRTHTQLSAGVECNGSDINETTAIIVLADGCDAATQVCVCARVRVRVCVVGVCKSPTVQW